MDMCETKVLLIIYIVLRSSGVHVYSCTPNKEYGN